MKHVRLAFALILLAVGLAGCTTPNTAALRVGMSRDEAVKVMGEPNSVSAQGGFEFLNYTLSESNAYGGSWTRPYYVRLVDGKVQAYGYMEQMNRLLTPGSAVNAAAKSAALKVGMSKDEAIATMGQPGSVSAQGNYEYLNYMSTEVSPSGFGTMSRPFYVRLIDGRVEAFGFTDQIGRTLPIMSSPTPYSSPSGASISIESVSPESIAAGKTQAIAVRVKYTGAGGDKFRIAILGIATGVTHFQQIGEQVVDGASGEATVDVSINSAEWGNGATIRLMPQLYLFPTETGRPVRPLAFGRSSVLHVLP